MFTTLPFLGTAMGANVTFLVSRSDIPETTEYPIYPTAVALTVLSLPAWLLCVPPMIWHFNQKNIAAGSLILWLILLNFFNFINPLIWPTDNVSEWFSGIGLCDIQVRIQVGAVFSLSSCVGVIARRLANVMDTNNITVTQSKHRLLSEKVIEILYCWVIPAMLMILYYVVQRIRYFIFAISGCVAAYDPSWPSIVLIWMWGPIATFVTTYYAGLLVWRLYRYRREFSQLIAARNTSKSRFIRLFCMSISFIVFVLPYSIFLIFTLASGVTSPYSWSRVHGDDWNTVLKIPTAGEVRFDRWGEVVFGYILFFLFGTGTEANNSYKRMLTAIGLGHFFPSLYIMRSANSSGPTSSLMKTLSHKTKSIFSKSGSESDDTFMLTSNDPLAHPADILIINLDTPPSTVHAASLVLANTNDVVLPQRPQKPKSVLTRIFGRASRHHPPPILPISTADSITAQSDHEKSPAKSSSSTAGRVYAHVWSESDSVDRAPTPSPSEGVVVMHEVHQAHQDKRKGSRDENSEVRKQGGESWT